jgi:hypothetical protein
MIVWCVCLCCVCTLRRHSETDLGFLRGSMCQDLLATRRREILADYDTLNSTGVWAGKISVADFMWARLVVSSRLFGLVVNWTRSVGLVPFLDLINHAPDAPTQWDFEVRACLVMKMNDFLAPPPSLHSFFPH